MGGRERRRSRVCSRLAIPANPSVVATLEVRPTAVSEGEEKASSGREPMIVFTGLFV